MPYLLMVRSRWTRDGFAHLFFGLIGLDGGHNARWRVAVRKCTTEELTLIGGGYDTVLAPEVPIPNEWRDKALPRDDPAVVSAATVIGQLVVAEQERRSRGGTPSTAVVWTVPRGAVESGESTEAALLRELFEETRVDVRQVVSVTPRLGGDRDKTKTALFDVTFGPKVSPDRRMSWPLDNGYEIAEVRWVAATHLTKMIDARELAGIDEDIAKDVVPPPARSGLAWARRCHPRQP